MKQKCLAVGIILLFVGVTIVPAIAQNTEKSQSTSKGDWLYVGGSGPGNYSRIQDAIDDAVPDDIIYVYKGTYYEALSINILNLTLIGEERENTVIDGRLNNTTTVSVQYSFFTIQGFTIIADDDFYGNGIYIPFHLQNIKICNNNFSSTPHGVNIAGLTKYMIFENNTFFSNYRGVSISAGSYGEGVIRNNTFINNSGGLVLGGIHYEIVNNTFLYCQSNAIKQESGCGKSMIRDNIFIGNGLGIYARSKNEIIGNHFENNEIGVKLYEGANNNITQNNFINNEIGVNLFGANNNITQNNFINNEKDATFSELSRSHGNNWNNNYWDDSFFPFGYKFLFGKVQTKIKKIWQPNPNFTNYYWIRWINFDYHPAQDPYDI